MKELLTGCTFVFSLLLFSARAYAIPIETIIINGESIGTWSALTGWNIFFGDCIIAADCYYGGKSSLGVDPASTYRFDDELFYNNVPPFSGAGRSFKFIPLDRVGSAFNWRDATEPHQRTFFYCVSGVDSNCPIKVAETVPESSALALIGMGLALMIGRRAIRKVGFSC